MEPGEAKAKLSAVAQELGHEFRVFINPASAVTTNETSASSNEEADDFYEFTPEDYYRLMSDKMGAQSQILKTRKMREAEVAARRARITKAVIRVRFPDNYILEIKFHPSDKIQSLMDLLRKVIARPDLPFYVYTTPPKERIKDTSKDFYSAGYAPGAIVYFSYDMQKDLDNAEKLSPYLREDILALEGFELTSEEVGPVCSESTEPKPATVNIFPISEPKPAAKKPAKPKWLKL